MKTKVGRTGYIVAHLRGGADVESWPLFIDLLLKHLYQTLKISQRLTIKMVTKE